MARTTKDQRLDTPSIRLKLKPRPGNEPFWRTLETGFALGYRPGKRGGSWIARHYDAAEGRRFHKLGSADDVQDANGINVLSFGQAAEKAKAWFAQLAEMDSGEVIKGRYTVADAMTDYLQHLEREKRTSQYRTKSTIDAHILPVLGNIQLSDLKHGKVKKWRDSLADGSPRKRTGFVKEKVWCIRMVHGKPKGQYRMRVIEAKLPLLQGHRTIDDDPETLRKRHATANRVLTVLKAAFNHARVEGKVSTKAAWENVKPFRNVDVPKVRFLSMNELKAFVPACEQAFQRLAKGALATGARYGELAAMGVEDFSAANGTVYVAKGKNGESRHIHLNDEGIAFFAHLVKGCDPKDRMFVKANGNPWETSEQQRPIEMACEATHIEGVTFHILRHTYASHAVMNGMPLEVLQKQLGHKDLRITLRHYAHLCSDYKQQSVRAHAPSFGFVETPIEIMNVPLLVQRKVKRA
jgi:integrase